MLQFLGNGICKGAVFAIVGMGFGLIYTTTRVFHIAHAGVFVLAGYAFSEAMISYQLPLTVGIPLTLAIAAVAGMLIDSSVYRPLARRGASPTVVLISSLGVLIVIENAIA